MESTEYLSQAIRELYRIVDGLDTEYSQYPCSFLLDGNLLGSIGEVYAAERYGLELFTAAHEKHDAKTLDGTGRQVQVKVTQERAKKKVVGLRSEPDYLLVIQVGDDGEFREVYNGPGGVVWDRVKDRPVPSNGQRPVSLAVLERLNAAVAAEDRV